PSDRKGNGKGDFGRKDTKDGSAKNGKGDFGRKDTKDGSAKLDGKARPRIKVFQLSHADPEELKQILEDFRQATDPSAIKSSGVRLFGDGNPSDPRGERKIGLAVDTRTRSLIVRGSEKELQVAADLVAVLDLQPEDPSPRSKPCTPTSSALPTPK